MNLETRDNALHISGEVTVKTVNNAAYAQFQEQCRLKTVRSIDFSGVTLADSACVSLLLSAIRLNSSIALQHIPPAVSALAGLYEINEWVKP